MYLWLAVTSDKYELPLYVADTCIELANKYGVSKSTVLSSITRNKSGSVSGRKFIKIEVEYDVK